VKRPEPSRRLGTGATKRRSSPGWTGLDRRSRRYWRRAAREWEGREEAALERYDRVVSPELDRLGHEIKDLEDGREDLSGQRKVREEWLWSHPEAARRLEFLDHEVTRAEQASAPSMADDLADGLGRRLGPREPDLGLDAGIDLGP
jgi:hypothetical protein